MKLVKRAKNFFGKSLNDKRGQGMTEYILLLVLVVGLVLMFKKQIKGALEGKIGQLSDQLGEFDGN